MGTENIHREYRENIDSIFDNKKADIALGNKVLNIMNLLINIEANANDGSTLIVDLADLKKVVRNRQLNKAVKIVDRLE